MHRDSARIPFYACLVLLTLGVLIWPSTAAAAGPNSPATTTPTGGKFDISFSITIRTSIPSDATISCSVFVDVEGEMAEFAETYVTQGTRNGNTATCTNWFYYSWMLLNPSGDMVSLTYTVTAVSTSTGNLPLRESTQGTGPMPVPANGAVTRVTVDSTL